MAKFKLKKSYQIGSPDAETDEQLLDVFISIENLNEILDTKNQKSILLGRTGSGKSAIIKYIKEKTNHHQEIAPEAMSLRFLSNSTILKYFDSIGVNLNLFYKVLWKHVFIVELLKMYFENDKSETRKTSFFERIKNKLTEDKSKLNTRRQKAINYMENWSSDFWQQTEVLIKSFEKNIQEKFASSIGIKSDYLNLNSNDEQFRTEKFIAEARQKAESIISNSLVVEILDIIDIMKEDLFNDHQRKFYILIDDLDKDWIEDSFRLDLIGAMIDVIKEFRQLLGVKIVISLRENLNEIVFLKHLHKGNQREKLKPLYSFLTWDTNELTELLNKRLKLLSEDELDIKQAFLESRRGKKNSLEYILERTFYRPRDVISFVNHIIENANNKSTFTKDIIAKAEPAYSLERFQALEDEWIENYGKISIICEFLRGINNGFKIKSINETQFADVFLDDNAQTALRGELAQALIDWKKGVINYIGFLKQLLFVLFRIGVLGVKKGPTYPVAFYYTKEVIIEKSDISHNSKFYVHPALYSYLKVNVLDLLPEE